MAEWWSYSPSDFLLFSASIYYRQIEFHNASVWPSHVAALVLGLAVLRLLDTPGPRQGRIIASILALCWVWVAWSYLLLRYATINWAAVYLAYAFTLQAALLALLGVAADKLSLTDARPLKAVAAALFAFALIVQPMIGPTFGRSWRAVEVFGIMPNPTVVATLAILSLSTSPVKWLLLAVPILWCAVSGATEWTMGAPDWWIMPAAILITMALAIRTSWPARLQPAQE
jgi:hypothetical protein